MEFEDSVGGKRTWVQVYGEAVSAVLVEDSIVWATRSATNPSLSAGAPPTPWPALVSGALWAGMFHSCLLKVPLL